LQSPFVDDVVIAAAAVVVVVVVVVPLNWDCYEVNKE
jgi:hypothetical protein